MNSSFNNILDVVREILSKYPLCDRCLGRLFAQIGHGYTNTERGYILKHALLYDIVYKLKQHSIEVDDKLKNLVLNLGSIARDLVEDLGLTSEKIEGIQCAICNGVLDKLIEDYAKRVGEILQRSGFKTFIIGVKPPRRIVENELKLVKEFNLSFWESVKNELKREIGKRVRDLYGLKPDFEDPQVIAVIDVDEDSIHLEIPSMLLYGIYWKLGRRISQVPWITKNGRRKYPLSIEDVLQNIVDLFQGERAVFHGAGREDVDVRMLGSGRPFVLEIRKPLNRDVDLATVENKLNSVCPWMKFRLFMRVNRDFIGRLKESSPRSYKVYRALVMTRNPVTPEDLRKLEEFFRDRVVTQRTPTRVLRRKKDLIRRRKVLEVATSMITPTIFEALIRCEGGLYIKELVSGDNGRTTPSFSEVLRTEAMCIELDAVYVQKQI